MVKTVWQWCHTEKQTNGTECRIKSAKTSQHIYGQPIFNKGKRYLSRERIFLSISGAETTGFSHGKEGLEPYLLPYKKFNSKWT